MKQFVIIIPGEELDSPKVQVIKGDTVIQAVDDLIIADDLRCYATGHHTWVATWTAPNLDRMHAYIVRTKP
jgi:hypothetical protein